MAPKKQDTENPFRMLPSVDEALRDAGVAALAGAVPRDLLARFVQDVLDDWRREIKDGGLDGDALAERLATDGLARALGAKVRVERGRGVKRAVNVGGVVLNTGLGRAPVHPEVAVRMGEAAKSYCVLEVDRFSGERNERDERLSELLVRLTGCEAGIAVNNNAAAAMLMMHTFAFGREAIVSRGELVEIGGSFRVPAVMASANVRLVEVGATNRTRIADYAGGITPDTGLLIKVHPSNFRIVGFTEEVDPADMAKLGAEHGIATGWDLGSGLIEHPTMQPLDMIGDETVVRDAVASGVDVVSFSGDKLLGGPQAGLIVGTVAGVGAMRKNALYRAMRCDKVTLAGLEATLELILAGRGDELPARTMLRLTRAEVEPVARELAGSLEQLGYACEVVESRSQPGSGSAPDVFLDTFAIRARHQALSAGELAAALRACDPPVFTRVQDDVLWIDPRTLLPGDREALLGAFRSLG